MMRVFCALLPVSFLSGRIWGLVAVLKVAGTTKAVIAIIAVTAFCMSIFTKIKPTLNPLIMITKLIAKNGTTAGMLGVIFNPNPQRPRILGGV